MQNPFDQLTGSERLRSPYLLLLLGFSMLFGAVVFGKMGLVPGMGLIILPFVFTFLYLIFKYPETGVYVSVFLGFTILGLSRYVDFQVGL